MFTAWFWRTTATSERCWKNKGVMPQDMPDYVGRVLADLDWAVS